ncbi:hypothetical protein I6N90_02700 [Paenibacillus sp. GSMTC-2017]|uniref:hypothetical protein n=1 Tax=Paenibacillus sp. GSMTC-2017 TaxID=2794350 RepID=UPI0018D8796D|nr:hypothetical protein [Paenibacillus sp. GSMTC-2017]MBH5316718.1 hypothetical protein [Paenibacillus sp. GSMTC-2017]
MLKIKVIYEESGEDGLLNPVWMIVDCHSLDWNKTLTIDITAPFQRITYDEFEGEHPSITVPDFAYTRYESKEHHIGIMLPLVKKAAFRAANVLPSELDLSSVERLVLRISDIEDVLQYSIRTIIRAKCDT